MEKTTYSIWLQNSSHNQDLLNLIDKFAKEESKDSFFPHVTLVTHISSEEEAINIANDTEYGLVSYIWSDHLPTIMCFETHSIQSETSYPKYHCSWNE